MTAGAGTGPGLAGQAVVVIGGSSGIGLETARRARAEGADVVLTGRDPGRLSDAAHEVGAGLSASFDATDLAALDQFFASLPGPVDHVMITAGGRRSDLERYRWTWPWISTELVACSRGGGLGLCFVEPPQATSPAAVAAPAAPFNAVARNARRLTGSCQGSS